MERNCPRLIRFSNDDSEWRGAWIDLPTVRRFGSRGFPSPADYRTRVDLLIRSARHLRLRPEAVYASAQRDWHVRGQTGCMFARLAAKQADTVRWDYVVTLGPEHDASTLAAIEDLVTRAVAEPDCQVLSVLFPDIYSSLGLVAAIRGLVSVGHFWLERDEVEGSILKMYLRYPVDSTAAWVMAFAPLDFLPSTRRGPFAELTIRVKRKPENIFHRLNQDRAVAHLADVPLAMAARHWEHRWQSTMRRTRMVLGHEPDDESAARSTLSVPLGLLAG